MSQSGAGDGGGGGGVKAQNFCQNANYQDINHQLSLFLFGFNPLPLFFSTFDGAWNMSSGAKTAYHDSGYGRLYMRCDVNVANQKETAALCRIHSW